MCQKLYLYISKLIKLYMDNSLSAISLRELSTNIKNVIERASIDCWVIGEISDINVNYSGHCYLELIEKSADGLQIVARQRATIWASVFKMIRRYFESATNNQLAVGMRILVKVAVFYHEVYGLSLNIKDIEPSFTLGDMAQQRMLTLKKLEDDGIIDMNKECQLSAVPQRIAVISSATAAGYGDFTNQLNTNKYALKFVTELFQAQMQGNGAAESIISALDCIYNRIDEFDVVVIIRGGGGKSDLICFDDYELAAHIAQFPIPILTGIGHERDDSVADVVAFMRLKTPTAVAEYLISVMVDALAKLSDNKQMIINLCREPLERDRLFLQNAILKIIPRSNLVLTTNNQKLDELKKRVVMYLSFAVKRDLSRLDAYKNQLRNAVDNRIAFEHSTLDMLKKQAVLLNPDTILKRGYTITEINGKRLTSKLQTASGDKLATYTSDGVINSVVK